MERTKRVKKVKENSEGPIERRIIIGLITNDNYTREVLKIGDPVQLLESSTAKMLAGWCIEYFKKYDKSPNKDIDGIYYDKLKSKNIRKELADEISEDILPSLSAEYEKSVNPFLLDETVKYFKERSLQIYGESILSLVKNGQLDEAEKLQNTYKPIHNGLDKNNGFNAWEISTMEIKPVEWLIENLLPKGLTVFGGKSKLGKSYLMLNMMMNLAQDEYMFSDDSATGFRGPLGNILYLALEDPLARVQKRIFDIEPNPTSKLRRLDIKLQWKKLKPEGLVDIETWIKSKRNPRLIVIDTMAKVWSKSSKTGGGGLYAEEYEMYSPLADLAHTYNMSIIVITHTKKTKESDVFDEILGGAGTQGPADNLMVLSRHPEQPDKRILSIRGKELDEKHLVFQVDGKGSQWFCLGDSVEVMKTHTRQSIRDYLKVSQPKGYGEIYQASLDDEIDVRPASVSHILRKMVKDEVLEQDKHKKYSIAGTNARKVDGGIASKLNRRTNT